MQGVEVMYDRIEAQMASGFRGLTSQLTSRKMGAPGNMIGSHSIGAQYGGVNMGIQPPSAAYLPHSHAQPAMPMRPMSTPMEDPQFAGGLMPGGPIDMFIHAAADTGLLRRGGTGPQSLLGSGRNLNISGGSTASLHSQASHPSDGAPDPSMRISYQDMQDLKNRSS